MPVVAWVVSCLVGLLSYLLVVLRVEPRYRFGAAMAQFPGPNTHPVLGHNLLEMAGAGEEGRILEKIAEWRAKYGPVFRVWYQSTTPTLFLIDPDLVKNLLNGQNDVNNYCKGYDHEFQPFLGRSILLSYGDTWRRKRYSHHARVESSKTAYLNLNRMYPIFASAAARLLARWNGELARSTGSVFRIPDMSLELKKTSLDIIGLAAFGYGFDPDVQEEGSHIVEAFESVLSTIEQRSYDFISWPNWLFCNFTPTGRKFSANVSKLQALVYSIIKKRRQVIEEQWQNTEERNEDLLDLLIEARDREGDGKGFSDQQIMEEVMTFMFAGHETTSIALSWTLYLLSEHSDIETKLREEIVQILDHRSIPTLEDLPRLQYLDMILLECQSMRLYPPQPGFVRRALRDNSIGSYRIPKGTEVTVVPYLIHRDPTLWSEPEVFNPERFNTKKPELKHPFAYLPFSGGLRSCIGRNFALMEARVLLATIVANFRVRLVEGSRVIAIPSVTLRPHGLHVTITSHRMAHS